MSDQNVELVRQLQPAPEVDLTDFFGRGDDERAEILVEAFSAQFTDDFVCIFHGLSSDPRAGIRGLRRSWLDWLEPWETYRVEIDRVRGVGERVLVFSRDFGRRRGMEEEVELKGSAVWTVRDAKVARAEFFTDRAEAIKAAGLPQ